MTTLRQTRLPALTRAQVARYAGVVGDFNPVHVDEVFARSIGLPSVIAHGPLTATLALDAIVGQVGRDRIQSLSIRLKAPYLPGQELVVVPLGETIELRSGSGTVLATATVGIDDPAPAEGEA